MSDLSLIKKRNQLMLSMIGVFILFDVIVNLLVKDIVTVEFVLLTAFPCLLLVTYLVWESIKPILTMYLISILFMSILVFFNAKEPNFINLFFLVLPPIFSASYHDGKHIVFTTIVSAGAFSYFYLINGDRYFNVWDTRNLFYFLFFYITFAAINIYESRFSESIRTQLIDELNRVKKLQNYLHDSERRYRAMIKQSSEGIFAFNPKDKKIVETNERFCEMLGYDENELLNLFIYDFNISDRPSVDDNIEMVLKNKNYFVGEKVYRCKSGSLITVVVSGTKIILNNETVILANVHDVTEQKGIEYALKENEQQLRQIYNNMADMIVKIDLNDKIRFVSPACKQIIGYEQNELLFHSIFANIYEEDLNKLFSDSKNGNSSYLKGRFVFRYKHKKGKIIWLESSGDELVDEEGNKKGTVIVCRDITDRIEMEEKNRKTSARLEALISNMPYGILAEDKNHRLILLNEQFRKILPVSLPAGELTGVKVEQITEEGNPIFLEEELYEQRSIEIIKNREKVLNEEWQLSNGRIISRDAIPIFVNNHFDGFLWQFKDVTEQKRLEAKFKEASLIDGLTKIPNRRFLDEMLSKEWNRCARTSKPLTIVMIDIDYFKKFNDRYGHQAGDECLKMVAQTIKQELHRPFDFVSRYGGEEFVVILPETNQEGGEMIAEKIRSSIESLEIPHAASSVCKYVTCSLGVATVTPSPLINPDELINMSDKALYQSKTLGRNQVNNFKKEMVL